MNILHEMQELAQEIQSNNPSMSGEMAMILASELLPDLLAYALQWDRDQNHEGERYAAA